jgi:hypothetical protein
MAADLLLQHLQAEKKARTEDWNYCLGWVKKLERRIETLGKIDEMRMRQIAGLEKQLREQKAAADARVDAYQREILRLQERLEEMEARP